MVDLPTPPLPEATAMTAEMPGNFGLPRHRRLRAGRMRMAVRRGRRGRRRPAAARAAAPPALRSAVSAIIATLTPGMARTAFSACARTLSQARASAASTLIEKNTLPSVTVIADSTLALVKGDAARRHHPGKAIENLLLRHAHRASPWKSCKGRPIERCSAKGYLAPTSSRRSAGAAGAAFLGGLVVQLDHDPVGVVDEDLPEVAAGTWRESNSMPLDSSRCLHRRAKPWLAKAT